MATTTNIDLTPDIVNISLYENDGWYCHVELKNPDGTVMDLTGATIKAQLAPKDGSAKVDLNIVEDVLAEGTFYYGQDAAAVAGKYDVQVTLTGVPPRTYVRGGLKVTPDVTED